jgi:DinB family protein
MFSKNRRSTRDHEPFVSADDHVSSERGLAAGTIDVLASTPATLRALLVGMPRDAVEQPGPEGWSARDVVAHLLARHDDALVGRVRAMLDQDDPSIPDIPDETGLDALRGRPVAELCDEFASRRAEATAWLRTLTDEQLARGGRHEIAGAITIADVLHHLAYHDLVHLAQAARLIAAPMERRRGAIGAAFPDEGG